jgi:hypothetical protein
MGTIVIDSALLHERSGAATRRKRGAELAECARRRRREWADGIDALPSRMKGWIAADPFRAASGYSSPGRGASLCFVIVKPVYRDDFSGSHPGLAGQRESRQEKRECAKVCHNVQKPPRPSSPVLALCVRSFRRGLSQSPLKIRPLRPSRAQRRRRPNRRR